MYYERTYLPIVVANGSATTGTVFDVAENLHGRENAITYTPFSLAKYNRSDRSRTVLWCSVNATNLFRSIQILFRSERNG